MLTKLNNLQHLENMAQSSIGSSIDFNKSISFHCEAYVSNLLDSTMLNTDYSLLVIVAEEVGSLGLCRLLWTCLKALSLLQNYY